MNGKTFAGIIARNRRQNGTKVTVAGTSCSAITTAKDSTGQGTLLPAGERNAPTTDARIFNVSPTDFPAAPAVGANVIWMGKTYLIMRVMPDVYNDTLVAYRLEAYSLDAIFWNLCDLYRPRALSATADGSEGADPDYVLAYSGVSCYYEGTPEFDAPTLAGITLEVSILTSDRWWFRQTQEVGDTWLIVMKSPEHPFYDRVWTAQGNQYMNAISSGNGTQMIYSRSSPSAVIPAS